MCDLRNEIDKKFESVKDEINALQKQMNAQSNPNSNSIIRHCDPVDNNNTTNNGAQHNFEWLNSMLLPIGREMNSKISTLQSKNENIESTLAEIINVISASNRPK